MDEPPRLPPLVEDAVLALKRRLETELGDRLREVRVFGSVARGEAGEGSDVDVLVVLDRIRAHRDRITVFEAAHDAGFDRDPVVQALVLGEDELRLLRERETALATDLDRDGISL